MATNVNNTKPQRIVFEFDRWLSVVLEVMCSPMLCWLPFLMSVDLVTDCESECDTRNKLIENETVTTDDCGASDHCGHFHSVCCTLSFVRLESPSLAHFFSHPVEITRITFFKYIKPRSSGINKLWRWLTMSDTCEGLRSLRCSLNEEFLRC